MIKKIIGWAMLAFVFALWVGKAVLAYGWKWALGILAGSCLSAVVIVAVFLIVWRD